MNTFSDVQKIDRDAALNGLLSGNPRLVCTALVSIAYHDEDWRWAQDQFLNFLESPNPEISGLAATCLGHLARIHRVLDKEKVLLALQGYVADPRISGRVSDALDDINMFLR